MVALDSGAGLANATPQQRLVPVRLFYAYLIEEGLGEPDRPGQDGLGTARHRHLRRTPPHRVDHDLHPPVGLGPRGKLNRGMQQIHSWCIDMLTRVSHQGGVNR